MTIGHKHCDVKIEYQDRPAFEELRKLHAIIPALEATLWVDDHPGSIRRIENIIEKYKRIIELEAARIKGLRAASDSVQWDALEFNYPEEQRERLKLIRPAVNSYRRELFSDVESKIAATRAKKGHLEGVLNAIKKPSPGENAKKASSKLVFKGGRFIRKQ